MRFRPTPLAGAWELDLERHEDPRGYFARSWCMRQFEAHGLPTTMVQASVSFNTRRGTLRGMHFQWPPSVEGKLVRCEQGGVLDIIIDLRPGSATFMEHHAVELDARSGNGIYIPPGFAHGFQTLVDATRVLYLMTDFYAPELTAGFRHDDPAFGLSWPLPVSVVSERDRTYPDFVAEDYTRRFTEGGTP